MQTWQQQTDDIIRIILDSLFEYQLVFEDLQFSGPFKIWEKSS